MNLFVKCLVDVHRTACVACGECLCGMGKVEGGEEVVKMKVF